MFYDEPENPIETARAIRASLEYLQAEASKAGIEFAALMIGAAAEALVDWMVDQQRQPQAAATPTVASNVIPLRRSQGQLR